MKHLICGVLLPVSTCAALAEGCVKTVRWFVDIPYSFRETNGEARGLNVLSIGKAAAEKYRIKQLSDLVGTDFRLAAQIDVSYGADYDALMRNPQFKARVSPLTLRSSAWKMVERDRIDGLIADEVSGVLDPCHRVG